VVKQLVINFPTQGSLIQLATALGYYDAVKAKVIAQARVGIGAYFFNYVGAVVVVPAVYDNAMPPNVVTPAVMAPGLWARLRHNADPARLDAKIAQSRTQAQTLGITIYYRAPIGVNNAIVWTSDGVTQAPSYVDGVGVIA